MSTNKQNFLLRLFFINEFNRIFHILEMDGGNVPALVTEPSRFRLYYPAISYYFPLLSPPGFGRGFRHMFPLMWKQSPFVTSNKATRVAHNTDRYIYRVCKVSHYYLVHFVHKAVIFESRATLGHSPAIVLLVERYRFFCSRPPARAQLFPFYF